MNANTLVRSSRFIWGVRIIQAIFAFVLLGVTAQGASAWHSLNCTTPTKLAYHIAMVGFHTPSSPASFNVVPGRNYSLPPRVLPALNGPREPHEVLVRMGPNHTGPRLRNLLDRGSRPLELRLRGSLLQLQCWRSRARCRRWLYSLGGEPQMSLRVRGRFWRLGQPLAFEEHWVGSGEDSREGVKHCCEERIRRGYDVSLIASSLLS